MSGVARKEEVVCVVLVTAALIVCAVFNPLLIRIVLRKAHKEGDDTSSVFPVVLSDLVTAVIIGPSFIVTAVIGNLGNDVTCEVTSYVMMYVIGVAMWTRSIVAIQNLLKRVRVKRPIRYSFRESMSSHTPTNVNRSRNPAHIANLKILVVSGLLPWFISAVPLVPGVIYRLLGKTDRKLYAVVQPGTTSFDCFLHHRNQTMNDWLIGVCYLLTPGLLFTGCFMFHMALCKAQTSLRPASASRVHHNTTLHTIQEVTVRSQLISSAMALCGACMICLLYSISVVGSSSLARCLGIGVGSLLLLANPLLHMLTNDLYRSAICRRHSHGCGHKRSITSRHTSVYESAPSLHDYLDFDPNAAQFIANSLAFPHGVVSIQEKYPTPSQQSTTRQVTCDVLAEYDCDAHASGGAQEPAAVHRPTLACQKHHRQANYLPETCLQQLDGSLSSLARYPEQNPVTIHDVIGDDVTDCNVGPRDAERFDSRLCLEIYSADDGVVTGFSADGFANGKYGGAGGSVSDEEAGSCEDYRRNSQGDCFQDEDKNGLSASPGPLLNDHRETVVVVVVDDEGDEQDDIHDDHDDDDDVESKQLESHRLAVNKVAHFMVNEVFKIQI